MGDLRDYLREEIEEENLLGYLTEAESDRRIGLLDSDASVSKQKSPHAGSVIERAAFSDDDVIASWDEIEGPRHRLAIYVARPAQQTSAPGVLVIHENKGLVPYIEDVVRRLAASGYVALAPDLLSGEGGTASFADPAEATAALSRIPSDHLVDDLKAAVSALIRDPGVSSSGVGVLGFCFGGGMAWRLVTKDQRIPAAVPFYGPNPPLEDVAPIEAHVLGIYGELDTRITSGLPDIEAAMKSNGKPFEKLVLPNAQHAFHNDTNPDRYDAQAAARAWSAALEHFGRWLG